jgi:hypothetical protein
MSKLHFLKKESKGMHKVIQLISKKLYNKKMPHFMKVHVQWMNLMKNQIIQKCQSLEILKEKVARQRTYFLNHLTKKLCSMDSKYLTLGVGHCVRNNLAKKHVWLSIEIHFGIFYIFGYKQKYSY